MAEVFYGEPKDIKHFSYKHIDFHTCFNDEECLRISECGYDVQLMDMDCKIGWNFNEFQRCDIKIIVCSFAVWKLERTKWLLSKVNPENIRLVALTFDKKSAGHIQREFKQMVQIIPFEANPFYVNTQTLLWIKDFLH